jgi:predicted transcriptional regulator
MGNKNKTISFRVNEDTFEKLKDIAEQRDLSLSAVFRDYVDTLVAHDGKVRVVPEHEIDDSTADDTSEFPPKVEVPKSFVREHERLELEANHLRDQLDEYKQYVTRLRAQLEEEGGEDVIRLEELDGPEEDTEPYLGHEGDKRRF